MTTPTLTVIYDGSGVTADALAQFSLSTKPLHWEMLRVSGDGPLATATAALDTAAGAFVLYLDAGDVAEPDAVAAMVSSIEAAGDGDAVYFDELDGRDDRVIVKPDWSPERFRYENFVGGAVVMRTDLVRHVGGLREGLGAAALYDLVLRVTEQSRSVVHVGRALVRRGAGHATVLAPAGLLPARESDDTAARRSVAAHLQRVGIDAEVVVEADRPVHRIRRRLDPTQSVSVIVPTRGQVGDAWGQQRVFVVEAVRSALARTSHRQVEIVVVYDRGTPDAVLDELQVIAGERLVLVEYSQPFNFSEKCNIGSLRASGSALVLLNDDTEVRSPEWLDALVAPLAEPDVGMTGAKLMYDDDTIQFAGHVYSPPPPWRPRSWRHLYRGYDPAVDGEVPELTISRECSGVTAACAAVRRDVWEAVGGLWEGLPVNYNDVDLSYKVRAAGHRIVWVAECELYHFESKTRGRSAARPAEVAALTRRWGRPSSDPYYPWPESPPTDTQAVLLPGR